MQPVKTNSRGDRSAIRVGPGFVLLFQVESQPVHATIPGRDMTQNEDVAAPSGNLLDRLLRNPVVNAIAWIATVLGLILSIYFYVRSTKKRDLVYYVNPAQAIVVKTGESSGLHVFYGSHELTSDVTAAQIAVWNQGNDSIRPDNVLEQVAIRTKPSVPILEASIRKKSRDVIDVSLDQSRLSDGVVGVRWNILEQNDGAVIQIVYAGAPSNEIHTSGVVEGQGNIRQLRGREGEPQKSNAEKPVRIVEKTSGYVFATVGILMILNLSPTSKNREQWRRLSSPVRILSIIVPMMVLGEGLYLIFFTSPPNPPFGF